MVSPKDVPAEKLIMEIAKQFKKNYPQITPPVWAQYVKTGVHRDKVPENPDWWYIRSASILRKIFLSGFVGVESLRTAFGGRKQLGTRKSHFRKSGGKIIRKILQQLEAAKLVMNVDGRGRTLTSEGRSLLYRTSNKIFKEMMKTNVELKKYAIIRK
ncbi:MAG: 30S ribosomal protein S19e [Candidatus Methanomethylicia archaeon]